MSYFYLKTGEMIPFGAHMFQMGGFNHQLYSNDLPSGERSHHQNLRNKGQLGDVILSLEGYQKLKKPRPYHPCNLHEWLDFFNGIYMSVDIYIYVPYQSPWIRHG